MIFQCVHCFQFLIGAFHPITWYCCLNFMLLHLTLFQTGDGIKIVGVPIYHYPFPNSLLFLHFRLDKIFGPFVTRHFHFVNVAHISAAFYHFFTGTPLMPGKGVAMSGGQAVPVALRSPRLLRTDLPDAVSDLLMRLLAPEPAQRPPRYSDLTPILESAGKRSRSKVVVNQESLVFHLIWPSSVMHIMPSSR